MITKPKTENIIFRVVLPTESNTVEYRITRTVLNQEDTGEYIAYGINATIGDSPFDEIRDISTDAEAVQELINKCNRLSVCPEHFRDVVEDFVAGE